MGEMSEMFLGFDANDMFVRDMDARLRRKRYVSEDTDYEDSLPLRPRTSDLFSDHTTPAMGRYRLGRRR